MTEEAIGSLCERFVNRLKDNSSYNHHGHRFFRNGTVKEVFYSNQQDLRELFRYLCQVHAVPLTKIPELLRRTLTDQSVIFAILLFARGRQEVRVLQQFLDLVLEATTDDVGPLQFTDINLPVPLATATARFPLQGVEFYNKQFRFCAVTLMKREEVIYKDDRSRCPLPYLEQKMIGQGAFGQVWKVRIEQGHIQSRHDRTTTTVAVEYARKDFELNRERAFYDEREILNTILDQPRRHKHIMVALASLAYGTTYSLFFPLASCNLWEYLNGVVVEGRFPPTDWDQKSDIFRRGVNLAGALAFLHHEFRNQKLDVFSCYHLDLKPHNILVFDAYMPSETWKITDFGLSRVKGRGVDGEEDVELVLPILGRAQRRTKRLREPSTLNRRGEGTYLAPECSLPNGRVSSSSDVWSFGCIFSLVMSYIDSGPSGVLAFARQRRRQEHGDSFYTIKSGKPKLSSVVIAWFDQLKHRARASPFPMEHEIACRTLDFLQKNVLHPIRDQRISSKEVEENLTFISHLFQRKPSEASPPKKSRWPFRRISMSSAYTPQYEQLPIESNVPILGSIFSPGGDVLLFHSPQKITIFFPDAVLSALEQHNSVPKPCSITVPKASLECVASSSRYLCACLATSYFEVHPTITRTFFTFCLSER
jgi:serine/threonine protein kinase